MVGGIDQWKARFEGGGWVMDTGCAVATPQVGCVGVAQAVRVSA